MYHFKNCVIMINDTIIKLYFNNTFINTQINTIENYKLYLLLFSRLNYNL